MFKLILLFSAIMAAHLEIRADSGTRFKMFTSLGDTSLNNESDPETTYDSTTDYGTKFQLLQNIINTDADINESRNIAWNYTEKFLNSGNLEFGLKAINLTKKFIERRLYWIQYILTLSKKSFPNDNMTGMTSVLQARIRELNETKKLFAKVRAIYILALNESILEGTKNYCKNLTDLYFESRDYDAGVELLKLIQELLKMFELSNRCLETLWERYNLSEFVSFPWVENFVSIEQRKQEFNSMVQYFKEDRLSNDLNAERIVRNYIDITVYTLMQITGLVWNGVLLLIFVKHKEVRTTPNIMVLNLAVTDVLNVLINGPLFYIYKYYKNKIVLGEFGCKTFYMLSLVIFHVSCFLVVSLSFQRFAAVYFSFKQRCRLSTLKSSLLYTAVVWSFAIAVVIAFSFVNNPRQGYCITRQTPFSDTGIETSKYVELFYLLVFCVFLPILVAVFGYLTARKLKANIPGELRHFRQETSRLRSANVVKALVIAFAITNMPRAIWFTVIMWFHLDMDRISYLCIDRLTYYLLFSNACFNPIALFIACETFRALFKRYLFCCTKLNKISDTSGTNSTMVGGVETKM